MAHPSQTKDRKCIGKYLIRTAQYRTNILIHIVLNRGISDMTREKVQRFLKKSIKILLYQNTAMDEPYKKGT